LISRDTAAKVPQIAEFVKDAKAKGGKYVIPLVVYDLPDRDCAAYASNGEYSVASGGLDNYKKYIDAVKKEIVAAGDQKFVLVIGMNISRPRSYSFTSKIQLLIVNTEPDSLANLITNMVRPLAFFLRACIY
jgi:cellulose 1,4-beta-cellobiosidase